MSLKMMRYFQKVLKILMLFIYPFIPLSMLFSHFSGLFPVPYRLCIVSISHVIKLKCCHVFRHRRKICFFLIKLHNKTFGLICLVIFLFYRDCQWFPW